MRVEGIFAERSGSRWMVGADVDGVRLWFSSDDVPLEPAAEAFASALLIPALAKRVPLEMDVSLDPQWLANVPRIMSLLQQWWRYPPQPIRSLAGQPGGERAQARAQCFTGGVDSFFTLLTADPPPDFLVYVHGFDIPLNDHRRLHRFLPALSEVAADQGARRVLVSTNLREHPAFRWVSWRHAHGGALAAVGYLLRGLAGTLVIPPSFAYQDDFPLGSHWALDPLWSSSRLKVEHGDASLRRWTRAVTVSDYPLARRHLRVCWENRVATGNCSRCEKCVRTMLYLAMIGKLESFETFDLSLPLTQRLDKLGALSPHLLCYYRKLRLEITDPDLAAALDRLLRRSQHPLLGPLLRGTYLLRRWLAHY